MPSPLFSNERLFGSIPSYSQFFSFYLSTGETHWSDNHTLPPTIVPDPFNNNGLPLWRYILGFARGLQLKYGIRNPLIQLNIGIFRQAVIPRRAEELLLD